MRTLSILGARLGLALTVAVPLAVLPVTGASADGPRLHFGTETFSGAGVEAAYRNARAHRGLGAERRAKYVRDAATQGRFLNADFVDYLRFERTDGLTAEVVVPRSMKLTKLDVRLHQDADRAGIPRPTIGAGAEMTETESVDAVLGYPSGPGFYNYTIVKEDFYDLHTSRGWMRASWGKRVQTDDLDPNADYWVYWRKSIVHPKDITGWDDDVMTMGMRSYPTTSTKPKLRGLIDWTPPADTSWNGSCTDVGLSIRGVGLTYKACDVYTSAANWNMDMSGDYSINWRNSYYFPTGGPVEMAYIVYVKTYQNAGTLYYNDYQYFNMMTSSNYTWPEASGIKTAGCGTTNQSANC